MKTKKKQGDTIRNWQLHHLDKLSKKDSKIFLRYFPKALLDPGPVMFTGTVEECITGRWNKGYHMRSSYIISIDREKDVIETMNTVYKVMNEGGDTFKDLGNGVLGIFY